MCSNIEDPEISGHGRPSEGQSNQASKERPDVRSSCIGSDGTQVQRRPAHGMNLETLLAAITPPRWNLDEEEEGYGRGSFWGSICCISFLLTDQRIIPRLGYGLGTTGKKNTAFGHGRRGVTTGLGWLGIMMAFGGFGFFCISGFWKRAFWAPWRLHRDTTRWSCNIRGGRGA